MQVGRDVSIVGFGDVGLASWPSFDLTTFSQPARPMAQQVVTVTLERIEDPQSGPVHGIVPGELIVRSSARRPPATWKPPQP